MPRSAPELSYTIIGIICVLFGIRITLFFRKSKITYASFGTRIRKSLHINQTTFRNYRSAYALQILGEIIKYSKCKCVLPTCRVQQFSMAHCSFTLQKRRPAVGQGSPPRPPHLNYHRGWPAPAFHQLLFFLCRTVVLQGYSMLAGRFSDA